MAAIRITDKNNSLYISGKSFPSGTLTATASGDYITIARDENGEKIVRSVYYRNIHKEDGTQWGLTAAATVTALNNYIQNDNPDLLVKQTDRITSLTGVTESDFQSKPGYTVFVGPTDGSLQTSIALLLDGSNVRLNGELTSSTNTNIKLKPGGTGNVEIGNFVFDADQTTVSDGDVLTYNSGTIALATPSGGSSPWTTSGSDIYYTTGNVGVGTTTPAQALHVSGTDKHIYIEDGNLKLDRNNEGRIEFGISGQMWGNSNGNVVYLQKTGNNHRFDFDTNGGSLTVRDTSVSSDYFIVTSEYFQNYSGSQFKYVQHSATNNNNGVVLEYNNGTASAGNRGLVQVNGDLKVNDYTTGSAVEKIKLGNDGKIKALFGTENVLIGDAGTNITGYSNTAVGSLALRDATSANQNVVIGQQAQRYTTGSYNVTVGTQANMYTTGGSNVAVGGLAAKGGSTSTFANTVAVGYQALTALTTGAGNTAVGYQAGDGITTAGYNTVVGYSADVGTSNSSTVMGYQASGAGSGVVAIGYQAQGGVVTNGFQNTGLGYQSNYQGSSEKNVSLGAFAGYSGNIMSVSVGHGAGYSGADYGVFIGYQAGYNETGSNKLYIENSNSATPLIYGEFDNDLVRINGDLEVTGDIDLSGGSTRNLLVGGDQYVFQYATGGVSTNFGLYFNLSNTSYDFNNNSAIAMLSVNAVNGNTTIAGTLEVDGGIKIEKTSNTDYDYRGDVVYFGATTSMTQGDLYYFNSSGNWAQADANAVASSGSVLLAIALGTASDTDGMLLRGTFTMEATAIDGTEATGDELYVGTTAGHVTSDVSAYTTGDVVRVVGYCLDGTNGQIWFNPSNDFITLA